jgi:hypothetical protein
MLPSIQMEHPTMQAVAWVWVIDLVLGLSAAIAAFLALGWIAERRERAAYVMTLSAAARARLSRWESVNIDWRLFQAIEAADREQEAGDEARAVAAASQYNGQLIAALPPGAAALVRAAARMSSPISQDNHP